MNEKLNKNSWPGFAKSDTETWQRLLHSQIPHLYAMFLNRWPNPALAEELTQKTVFDAVRGLTTYDPEMGSPEEWITGIARNNIRLEIRKRAAGPSINGDITTYLAVIDKQKLPDEILEKKETKMLVRKAMDKLETKYRSILNQKYIENKSARLIAEKMATTEKAIHSLLYRAREALRKELKQLADLQ